MFKVDSYRNLGLVCALVFCLTVSCFAGLNFVVAQSGSKLVTPENIVLVDDLNNLTKTESLPWSNITDVNPIGPYSFMITPLVNGSGTFYQAINGTDNKPVISWTSTDYALTLNSTIYNLPQTSDGVYYGNVIFGSGVFFTSLNIEIPKLTSIWISGQGVDKTVLKFDIAGLSSYSDDVNHYAISYAPNETVMSPAGWGAGQLVKSISQNLKISDLTVDTQANQYSGGLYFSHGSIITLENLHVVGYWSNSSVTPWAAGYNVPSASTKGIYFTENSVSNQYYTITNVLTSGYGIGTDFYGDHLTATNLQSEWCATGLQLSYVYQGVITNFHAYFNAYNGIVFAPNSYFQYLSLINPSIENVASGDGGQYVIGASTYTEVTINNARWVASPGITPIKGATADIQQIFWLPKFNIGLLGTTTTTGGGNYIGNTTTVGSIIASNVTGNINNIGFYISPGGLGTTTEAYVALYSGSINSVDTLLASSIATTVSAQGWVNCPINVAVSNNTTYWIMVTVNGVDTYLQETSGEENAGCYYTSTYPTFPSTPSGVTYTSNILNAYANFTSTAVYPTF